MSKTETTTNASASSTNSEINFVKPPRAGGDGDSSSEISYVRLGQLNAGAIAAEGIYLGSSQNLMYPEKLDFKFKSNDGKTIVVNEGGNLKYRMEKIEAGTLVRVIYNGKQLITKGQRKGKMAHNVEVLVAE